MEQFDLFFSYEDYSFQLVFDLYSKLQDLFGNSIKLWIDSEQPNNRDLNSRLLQLITRTKCVVCFVSREYSHNKFCQIELDIALNKSHIIIMLDQLNNISFSVQSKLSTESRLNFYKNSEVDMWSGKIYEQFLKTIDFHIGEMKRLDSNEFISGNKLTEKDSTLHVRCIEFRSEVSEIQFNFTLINDTDQDFQMFWINFEGIEVECGYALKKDICVQNSFANHVWILRSSQIDLVFTLGKGLFNTSNCGVMILDLINQSKLKENRIISFVKGILPRFF